MDLDEPKLFAAMRDYVTAAQALADTGREGDARVLLDLAETKLIAGMLVRKALVAQGWTAPAKQPAAPTAAQPVG
jgi:hypothetical protein